MGQKIEQPVGKDQRPDHQPARQSRPAAKRHKGRAGDDAPHHRHGQAVGPGHVIEVKMVGGGEVLHHPHLLNASQNQGRPQDIEELDGDRPVPQFDPVSGQRRGWSIMSHKHGFFAPFCACSLAIFPLNNRAQTEITRPPGEGKITPERGPFHMKAGSHGC